MAVDFENAHDRANTTTGNLTENESFDEISAVNKQISSLKRSVSDMIAELNNGKAVWEDAKLLLTYSKPQGLSWGGNIELERLYRSLQDRNNTLVKYLQMSKEDSALYVDEIHEVINLCEVVDDSWLNEINLRHLIDEKSVGLVASETKLKEHSDEMSRMNEEEIRLIQQRKKYSVEIAAENQSIMKYKSRFEELSHHLNTFATGRRFVDQKFIPSSNQTAPLAEQMRCSFNELRRVNSSLEEKLVITGVSKQKTMKELKSVLTEIRASCSRNPSKFKALSADALDDINLSSHNLRDISAVWKAALPIVPSLSGDSLHTDLLTWLSVSMGHFCEEYLCDLADVSLTSKMKQAKKNSNTLSHVEEEARLVGVVSAESDRYRSISGALTAAVHDAQELLASKKFDSVPSVIVNACTKIKERLGARLVTFWRISEDKSLSFGFSSGSSNTPIKLNLRNKNSERCFTPPLFERSLKVTCSLDKISLDSTQGLPADVAAMKPLITEKSPFELFEAFSVSSSSGGLTVLRGDTDQPFQPFSGIYCEQFYRRINSAITPLQLNHVKEIGNQRPLSLVRCLFELREGGYSPHKIWSLTSRHMESLFRASNLNLFITIDSDPLHVVRVGPSSDNYSSVLEYIDLDDLPERFHSDALTGVSLIDTPATLAEVIRTNAPVMLLPENEPADLLQYSGNSLTTHLRPFSKGRSVLFAVLWTDMSACGPSEDDGLDSARIMKEAFFNPDSNSQKSILSTYLGLVESMLGTFFSKASGGFATEVSVDSYQVEVERDRIEISKLANEFS